MSVNVVEIQKIANLSLLKEKRMFRYKEGEGDWDSWSNRKSEEKGAIMPPGLDCLSLLELRPDTRLSRGFNGEKNFYDDRV